MKTSILYTPFISANINFQKQSLSWDGGIKHLESERIFDFG